MKRLSDIFDIKYGNQFDFSKMQGLEESLHGINFVVRSSKNNGIIAKVDSFNDIEPFESGLITVALGGSALASFVQPAPFYTAQNIKVLTPKIPLSIHEKLYYCCAIEKNKFRYNTCGREANATFDHIRVPSLEDIPKKINNFSLNNWFDKNSLAKDPISLNTSKWKFFKLDDIFEINTSKDDNSIESQYGTTPYISSTQYANGISGYIDATPSHHSDTITVARNGSVGSSFFHFYQYCASPDDVRILKPKFEINEYIGIFLITLLEKEKYRYAYGRKFGTKRMKETRLKLPATFSGNPDWQFMEDYIKSLPYSSSL